MKKIGKLKKINDENSEHKADIRNEASDEDNKKKVLQLC